MARKSDFLRTLEELPRIDRVPEIDDPRAEAWRRLGLSQAARREAGLFQVEGMRAVEILLADAVYPVREVIVVSEEIARRQRDTQDRIAAILGKASAAGAAIFDVSRDVFRRIADVSKIRGVMAIARIGDWCVESLVADAAERRGLCAAAVGLNDPGNLGTLMRTAYAFGGCALFALEETTDPYHPKVLRAAAGHMLRVAAGSWGEFRASCGKRGVRVIGLEARGGGAVPLDKLTIAPTEAVAVCVGSEGSGFPDRACDFDLRVTIPMRPGAESLNAGVAAALVLWQLRRT